MKIARKYMAPLSLLLVSTIVTVYGATLFTQTFPAVGTVVFAENCSTLTASATPASGSSGSVAFDCSGTSPFGTTDAFRISNGLSITPTFTLPSVYTDLSVFRPGAIPPSTSPCSSFLFSSPLTSNTAMNTFSNPALNAGSTSYCADFTSVPSTGLPTFTIAWKTNPPVNLVQFSQTFPATTGVTASANCSTLTANYTAIVTGSSGVVKFDCSGGAPFGTTPAFLVTAGSSLTPTFALTGTGYTALAVIPASAPVTSCITSTAITSGTAAMLSAPQYDYCATFTSAPSSAFGTFTVSWG